MDWSTLAVSTVTALAGIATGLTAARLQAKNTERQLQTQVDLLLREQQETNRTARRAAYHEFLDADRSFQALCISAQQIDRSVYANWQDRFDHAYNGLLLFGTDEVSKEAEVFAALFPRQLTAPPRAGRSEAEWGKAYSRGIKDCYFSLLPAIRERRRSLNAAMRGDVAPRARPEA